MTKHIFTIEELAVKSSLLMVVLFNQGGNVLVIFPKEFFSEIYLAYGLLGNLLFTGFTFWWKFEAVEIKEVSIRTQLYKIFVRTVLSTFMTFVILGLIKANMPNITSNKLLTIGVILGFSFEYYSKRSFINSIFKNLAIKVLELINKTEEKK